MAGLERNIKLIYQAIIVMLCALNFFFLIRLCNLEFTRTGSRGSSGLKDKYDATGRSSILSHRHPHKMSHRHPHKISDLDNKVGTGEESHKYFTKNINDTSKFEHSNTVDGFLHIQMHKERMSDNKDKLTRLLQFKDALSTAASSRSKVLLTHVDLSFYAMAVNFYLTCLKPFGLTNYIIMTSHPDACAVMEKYNINCFFYTNMAEGDSESNWGTQIFKNKMNIRTDFILDALRLNFSVFHTDIDVYCFKNILRSVKCPRESCDIAALFDDSAYNAGFLLINPSLASKQVYEKMKMIAKASPRTDDQAQLNTAIRRQKIRGGLSIRKLPAEQFQHGLAYYEKPMRYFAATAIPCLDCVVVHNNWIVSMAAKVYRAKEMHHWMYDGDKGGYYTSVNAKYIRYMNTLPGKNEIDALKAGLAFAEILNRTLILPVFSCGSPCPLNAKVQLTPFDKVFGKKYREHSFATHPLVPDSVKTSRSPLFVIASRFILDKSPHVLQQEGIKVVSPKDPKVGLNDQEILEHFKGVKESILEIHSLYGAFSSFINEKKQANWETRCKNGITEAEYRQYLTRNKMRKKMRKKMRGLMYEEGAGLLMLILACGFIAIICLLGLYLFAIFHLRF